MTSLLSSHLMRLSLLTPSFSPRFVMCHVMAASSTSASYLHELLTYTRFCVCAHCWTLQPSPTLQLAPTLAAL